MRLLHSHLQQNPTSKKIVKRYQKLSKREQILLWGLLILGVAYGFHTLVWQPIKSSEKAAQVRLDNSYKTHKLLLDNAELIASTQSNQSSLFQDRSAQQLQSLTTRIMRRNKLVAQRLNLEGDSRLQVWIENTAYADVAKFLEELGKNKVAIYSVQFVSRDVGMVDMRLTLD